MPLRDFLPFHMQFIKVFTWHKQISFLENFYLVRKFSPLMLRQAVGAEQITVLS
jgi:hypothetical protein